jgi:hypothetical protein
VELMRKISRIYQLTHHGTRLVIQRSSMVVTAYCLLPSSDVRSGLPDSFKQEIRLSPVDSPVGCFRVGMFSDPVEGDVTHTLRTAQKKPIEMTLIPVTVPYHGDLGTWFCIVST